MFERILLTVIEPKLGESKPFEYSTQFSIGNRKPYDLIIDGEFIETLHGQFDYSSELGWYYMDAAGILTHSLVRRNNGTTTVCSSAHATPIKSGDELILNKLVKIKILRTIDHTSQEK